MGFERSPKRKILWHNNNDRKDDIDGSTLYSFHIFTVGLGKTMVLRPLTHADHCRPMDPRGPGRTLLFIYLGLDKMKSYIKVHKEKLKIQDYKNTCTRIQYNNTVIQVCLSVAKTIQ